MINPYEPPASNTPLQPLKKAQWWKVLLAVLVGYATTTFLSAIYWSFMGDESTLKNLIAAWPDLLAGYLAASIAQRRELLAASVAGLTVCLDSLIVNNILDIWYFYFLGITVLGGYFRLLVRVRSIA
jgi:fructose-specific phosphotransferase system IIC component